MNRFFAPVAAVFLVASSSAFGAGAAQAYIGGRIELAIDGVPCGPIESVEGGDPRASVVVANPVGTTLPKKQITGVTYAPITVELAFPPEQPILDWIGDLCANRQKRRTLLLTRYNASGQVAGNALQGKNTLLTEVRFPVLDVASKDPARMTLVFTPESTQAMPVAAASSSKSVGTKTKLFSPANFGIQIGNLPTTRVSMIESITIKQPVAKNIVGGSNQVAQTIGTTEFSNLVLTIASMDIADWNTWRDSFVVKGTNDDASETNGSLELLAADMKTSLLKLEFSHVGIMRASPMKEGNSDAPSKFQAELYFESMAIGTAPAKPATPVAALTPVTTMAPVSAQMVPLSPAAAPTPAAGSAAGGAAAAAAGSGAAADGRAAGAATSPAAGSAAAGGAAAASENPSASGGAASGAAGASRASSADSTAPSGGAAAGAHATGTSDGAAASGGGAAAGGPAGAATAGADSGAGSASGASAGSAASGGGGGAKAGAAPAPPVTSSADQGARDLKEFPRPDGTVRKSFSSVRQKTYVQEVVVYSSKETLDTLAEFYTKNLTAAGWELNTQIENNNSIWDTHQIVLNWISGLRTVTITLAETKTGGAEIGVNLITKLAP